MSRAVCYVGPSGAGIAPRGWARGGGGTFCWRCGSELAAGRTTRNACLSCGVDPNVPRQDPLVDERVLLCILRARCVVNVAKETGIDARTVAASVTYWRRRGFAIVARRRGYALS